MTITPEQYIYKANDEVLSSTDIKQLLNQYTNNTEKLYEEIKNQDITTIYTIYEKNDVLVVKGEKEIIIQL